MILSSVTISNDAAKRLAEGELWFSARDIIGRCLRVPGIAKVIDGRKKELGTAFVSPDSPHLLRVFSRESVVPDRDFWKRLVEKAYARRRSLEKVTNAFRVVHSEADGIPGVVIDKYDDVWSMRITSSGAETIRKDLVEIIKELFSPETLIEKNDAQMRRDAGLGTKDLIISGGRTTAAIREGDQKFELDVLAGQKTGAYLDYRAFRLKARAFAKGACLDAFCYQGWFACQIAAGAESVTAVDSSAAAIEAARKNAKINGHQNVEFVAGDVFDYLRTCKGKFDFIHLDPPAFAKGAGGLRAAVKGYEKLIAAALKILKRKGTMFVSSCSHAITERVLEEAAERTIKKAKRKGKAIYRGIQDVDHPVLKGFAPSLYLKAVAYTID